MEVRDLSRKPLWVPVFCLALFAAATAAAFPVKLRDDSGVELRLARRPARIVSLSPSATEILFALGLEKKVVGVTRYCDYPPAAKAKEKIGDLNLDYEKIVALRPELVLAVGNMPAQSLARLRSLGLAVLAYSPTDLTSVMGAVEKIGLVTGRQQEARELTAAMRRRVQAVRDKLATLMETEKPRVFVEIWMDPVMTAGPGTFTAELIRLAGGRDIAADAKPWSPFSQELVLVRNPQIIISQCGSAAQIVKRPSWATLAAVRDGRVHDVDQNLFSRPGPRLVEALEILARLLHPARFR